MFWQPKCKSSSDRLCPWQWLLCWWLQHQSLLPTAVLCRDHSRIGKQNSLSTVSPGFDLFTVKLELLYSVHNWKLQWCSPRWTTMWHVCSFSIHCLFSFFQCLPPPPPHFFCFLLDNVLLWLTLMWQVYRNIFIVSLLQP